MAEQFRLGVVGAGMIARNSHIPAALAMGHINIAALVDPEIDRANRLAADFGIRPKIATDVSDVLKYVDGVIIATPNGTHKDLAIKCLSNDVSVLIEKPLAATLEEGEQIMSAAEESAGVVAVGYVTRFRNNIRQLETLLAKKYFGKITRFYHQFGTVGGWAPASAYNLDRENTGGGVLVVSGTHFLDRMLNLWGYPTDTAYRDDGREGIEANCEASFVFDGGEDSLRGRACYSKTAFLPAGLIIESEAGIVRLDDTDEAKIILQPSDEPGIEHEISLTKFKNSKTVDPFEIQLTDFTQAVMCNGRPTVDCEQGLLSLRLVDELYSKRQLINNDW